MSVSVHWLLYNWSLQCEENLFQKNEPYTFIVYFVWMSCVICSCVISYNLDFWEGATIYLVNHISVQFSCSVVSDSLRPHESQHSRPPYPSPTPEFTQTHVHRVSDAIQPCKKAKWLSGEALQIAVKRREAKKQRRKGKI